MKIFNPIRNLFRYFSEGPSLESTLRDRMNKARAYALENARDAIRFADQSTLAREQEIMHLRRFYMYQKIAEDTAQELQTPLRIPDEIRLSVEDDLTAVSSVEGTSLQGDVDSSKLHSSLDQNNPQEETSSLKSIRRAYEKSGDVLV